MTFSSVLEKNHLKEAIFVSLKPAHPQKKTIFVSVDLEESICSTRIP